MDGDEDDDDDGMVRSLPRTKVVGKEGKATPCRMEETKEGRTDCCLAMYVHTYPPSGWMKRRLRDG